MQAVVHALDVHIEDPVKIGFQCTFQVANVGYSGVVNEDVNSALAKYFVKSGFNAIALRYVAAVGSRIPATGHDFPRDLFRRVLVQV